MDMPTDLDIEPHVVEMQARPVPLTGISHDKKWSLLKDVLEALFVNHKVKDIAKMMKEQYGFDAK